MVEVEPAEEPKEAFRQLPYQALELHRFIKYHSFNNPHRPPHLGAPRAPFREYIFYLMLPQD